MKIVSLTDQAVEKLRLRAGEACNVLKVMGNPDRLMLLCMMMDVERSVGELESLTGIRQPTLSQQLGVLRFEELVQTRKDGKNIYYMLASPMVADLMHTLYKTFCLSNEEKNR